MPYQPGIPTGTVNLDVDYINIKNNFTALDTSFGVDHLPFSNATAQNGYHTVIHLVPNSGTATPVAGYGEVYCQNINDTYATDTNFFYQTGSGRNYQMTCNFTPQKGSSSANAGYTFLPGGIVMQWGVVNQGGGFSDGQTGTVLFTTNNKDFGTKLVTVLCTLEYNTSTPSGRATVSVDQASFAPTGFNWQVLTGGSSSYTRFNWVAIGF